MNIDITNIQVSTDLHSHVNTNLRYDVREIREYVSEEFVSGARAGGGLAVGIHARELGHGNAQLWHVDEHANGHATSAAKDLNPKQNLGRETESKNQAYLWGGGRQKDFSDSSINAMNKGQL
jgi:hypothetical protein